MTGLALLTALVAVWLAGSFGLAGRTAFTPDDSQAARLKAGQFALRGLVSRGVGEVLILNAESPTPTLTLRLRDGAAWTRMAAATQEGICLHLQATLEEARVLVSLYIPQGKDNPRYEPILRNVRARLCGSCWSVAEASGRVLAAGDAAFRALPDQRGVESWPELRARAAR